MASLDPPELAQARIPQAVLAAIEPTRARIGTVKQPDWLTERARQVNDRRIKSDDKIERFNRRRRLGEIGQQIGPFL